MDRHHIRRRRQHQDRRQPTHRRAHEPDVRRHSHQRTGIPRNAPERTQSATLRWQHPIHHDAGRCQTRPRWRILRFVPLPPRPQRVRHLQSGLESRHDVLREVGQGLRTRRQGPVCCQCAVGGQLSDVASTVSAADRRGLAGVEERASCNGGDANHAEYEGLCHVAGAFERGEWADEYGIAECRELYVRREPDNLNSMKYDSWRSWRIASERNLSYYTIEPSTMTSTPHKCGVRDRSEIGE